MLDDLGNNIDTAQGRLMATINKVDKALAISKDGKQSCCICILVIVVILLIILYVAV